jgi:phage-related protein
LPPGDPRTTLASGCGNASDKARLANRGLARGNIFVMHPRADYTIVYYSETVQKEILELPDTLASRYVVLTSRMVAVGPNLGTPYTEAFGNGLFELRLRSVEGIARVFFCTLVERRIVMLHGFVKKSGKTPPRERKLAETRMRKVKREDT